MSMFKQATKEKVKLRMAIDGPTGSGKTYSALRIATNIGKKVALLDTEGGDTGSANKYADEFHFLHATLTNFHPQNYINAIKDAEENGCDVLVIDSLSHAWMGTGGVLDQVDMAAKRSRTENRFTAWKEGAPLQKALIDAILHSNMHIIVTMRSKMEYEIVEEGGKKKVKKLGMAPIQRDDVQYEFDIVGDMDAGTMIISKTRCKILADEVIKHPGEKLAKTILGWLNSGVEPVRHEPKKTTDEEATPPLPDPGERGEGLPHGSEHELPGYREEDPPTNHNGNPNSAWNDGWAAKLREAREALTKRLGTPFTQDDTRRWLNKKYGISSHKDATQEMLEALRLWMLRVHRAGRLVD